MFSPCNQVFEIVKKERKPYKLLTCTAQWRMFQALLQMDNLAQVFFVLFFFFLWTIFKVFIEFVTILFLSYVLVFCCEACKILAPQPG